MQLPETTGATMQGTTSSGTTTTTAGAPAGINQSQSDVKVIESKTICYCSNFDLNINEWFNEYENIEIFKINMKKNLGKYLHKCFANISRASVM